MRNAIFRQIKITRYWRDSVLAGQLCWFEHICLMKDERIIQRMLQTKVQGKNCRGRPRSTWIEYKRGGREERHRKELRKCDINHWKKEG